MELEEIKAFWNAAGESFKLGECVTPTSRDPYLGDLEAQAVLERLEPDNRVLEIGCGDGAHSLKYAAQVQFLHGIDVSEPLLSVARQRSEDAEHENTRFVAASVLDIGQLDLPPIDCVISQRCLINLPTWDHQVKALDTIADLLPVGGRLLLTEGFQEELDLLNEARVAVALDPIRVVDYNRNLLHTEFDPFIRSRFEIEETVDYGFYLYASRVFHPLAVRPDAPVHDSPINRAARILSDSLDTTAFKRFSYNLLYILRKR